MMFSSELLQAVVMGVFNLDAKANDRVYYAIRDFINNHYIPALKKKGIKGIDPDYSISWDDSDFIDIYLDVDNQYGVTSTSIAYIEIADFGPPKYVSWNEGDEEIGYNLEPEDYNG